jgi:prepilin-type N-terminal cleavage/methylation domain-containing protein
VDFGKKQAMIRSRKLRSGFTLLEVLLASAISLLLLSALYVAMDIQLKLAQAGREAVDQATLVRSLLKRISYDLSSGLGPIGPVQAASSGSGGGGSAAGAGGASGAGGVGAAGGASSAASATAAPAVTTPAVQSLGIGVQGDNQTLTIFVSRLPPLDRTAYDPSSPNGQQQTGFSDQRRITYWLSSAGDGGLARQEILRVTADDENTQMPPGVPDEASLIIAPEVVSLQFRYFDGTDWQDTWDGSQPGPDGMTPMGPPRAIEVTIGLRQPAPEGVSADAANNDNVKTYVHYVAIEAANAIDPPTTTTGTTGQ